MKQYTAYECKGCRRTFILLTHEMLNSMGRINFIACPYCGCKKSKIAKETDNLKECMEERKYYRAKGGAWRQK